MHPYYQIKRKKIVARVYHGLQQCIPLLSGVLLFAVFISSEGSTVSPVQRKVHFSELWKFYRGDATGAQSPSFNDGSWETVCLPHTVRLESAKRHSNYDYYQGYCWYRKTFLPPESFQGKKVSIEFEAAMQSTDVYLNGEKIYSYLGGYNPFIIDITEKLQFGQENVFAVRLDNRVNGDVSPGNPAPDFYYYGGLYRYVNLYVTDRLHITNPLLVDQIAGGGVFVTTPTVNSSSAHVQVKTHIVNEYGEPRSVTLSTTILDSAKNTKIAEVTSKFSIGSNEDTTITERIDAAQPHLWHPDHPYLYHVRSVVHDDARSDRPADEIITTFGIRTISYSRSGGCQINGKRFQTRGANRHQDYGAIGNAVPVSGQYRDALLLKEGGFNFVRLSHYLQHPAFLDACDKLGIAVQASLIGWQHNGFSNSKFVENSLRDLRTMIRYYRNHPSIIMWESVHNESKPPKSFAVSAQAVAHEEYPGNQMYTVGQETNNVMDIYQAAVQQGGRDYSTGKPAGISEYAHWEEGGFTSTSNRTRADGENGLLEQAENHVWGENKNHELSWLAFDAVWVFNDYFGMAQYDKSLCSGGVIDVFRIPKFSYYCYRAQRSPNIVIPGIDSGPNVYIASHWTKSSTTSVWVFSNCQQVSLYLNDQLIATRTPDKNYGNIGTPTFTFNIPSFQAGILRADGLINETIVVSDTVRTPESARKVAVTIDTAKLQLVADGADLAIVYASVVDENGTVIPDATDDITFSVSGPGTIISGDGNPVAAEGGIAAAYVQTDYNAPGLITVTADASGLEAGSATVQSVPMTALTTKTVPNRKETPVRKTKKPRLFQRNSVLQIFHDSNNSFAGDYEFRLYDQLGRCAKSWRIHDGTVSVLDISGMARGVYCGKLITAGGIQSYNVMLLR